MKKNIVIKKTFFKDLNKKIKKMKEKYNNNLRLIIL